ncbi:MAG TPA: hypothetical protein VEK08_23995 [Planctomycetota bacterium]|nr:hypothetical protein [Planctomycetota bacterium]
MKPATLAFACLFSLSLLSLRAETPAEKLKALGAKVTEAGGVVTQVQVDAAKFTADDYKTLNACTQIKKLTINGKTLNDAALASLSGLEQLEELSTNETQLSDEGYKGFQAFKKLRSLALYHPSWDLKTFTGTGLAHLKGCPNLTRLTFAGSTVGDTGLEAIGQISQLKEFLIWHTMQTQAGNKHLLNLSLTFLKIGQRLPRWGTTPAPSFDASTIPLIAQMKSLERLELFEARLTAENLQPLKELPKLKLLSIHTCDISAADIDAVKAALPQVKVDFKPITDADKEATLVKKLKL